jgi:hypothetical protein
MFLNCSTRYGCAGLMQIARYARSVPQVCTEVCAEGGLAEMVQRVATVAFEGIEVRPVDVQAQVAPGMPAFAIVGLPDKAVSEARERVRSALTASGLALPARRTPWRARYSKT